MKKNSLLVAQLGVLATVFNSYITNPQNSGKSVEQMQSDIIAQSNNLCESTKVDCFDPSMQLPWKTIARTAVKKCTDLYPNTFINWKSFCQKNPLITAWLYDVCGSITINSKTYNWFTYNVGVGANMQMVLESATGSQRTKKQSIHYLTQVTNEFFEGTNINSTGTITDTMLLHVATASMFKIKAATPEMLEKYTGYSDWDTMKSTVDSSLVSYWNSVIAWPINNSVAIDSYAKTAVTA